MGWNDRDYDRRRPHRRDDDDDRDEEIGDVGDWVDDRADDPEAPDRADQDPDDDDRPDLIQCPNCRKAIVEDAEWCHHCGQFVEERKLNGRPAWVWAGIVLAFVVAVMWALARG
jgi:predicted nucleic acid-binding Zn ribbon protein